MNHCSAGLSMSTDLPSRPAGSDLPLENISDVRPVVLRDGIDAAMDLSGAVLVGDFLVLGADEGHRMYILRPANRGGEGWSLHRSLALAKQDEEADIEAITYGGGYLYLVGSHACRRRRIKPELSVRRNCTRMLEIERQPTRNRLYRVAFDTLSGELGEPEWIDLSKRLRKDPLLQPFVGIPSKENGVDIEGMAFRDGLLWLGFRGPVLRDNYVPVMLFSFDKPKRSSLRLVRLDGQGIRDMAALDEGFLILSGPVNDAPGPFCLWWWDGLDQIPGRDHVVRQTTLLGTVSSPRGAKAEGLALLAQDARRVEVMVVYDTNTATQAARMTVALPD